MQYERVGQGVKNEWNQNDKLKSLKPDIVHFNDEYIAIQGINKEMKIVTSRIAFAIEGMKVLTKQIN